MPKKKKVELDGSDACVLMHTALRKLCDSKITSAVYNLVHLICDYEPEHFSPWRLLGELVAFNMRRGASPEDALRAAHRVLGDAMNERIVKRREAGEEPASEVRQALSALEYTMACFSDEDWAGMAGYLAEG
jgi:hypothetical protein